LIFLSVTDDMEMTSAYTPKYYSVYAKYNWTVGKVYCPDYLTF